MIRVVVPYKDEKRMEVYNKEFIINDVNGEIYELIEDVPFEGEQLIDRGTEEEMFLRLINVIGGSWEEE